MQSDDEFTHLIQQEARKLRIRANGRFLNMASEIIEESDQLMDDQSKCGAAPSEVCLADIAQTLRGLMVMKGAELDLMERVILRGARKEDK